MQFTEWQPIDLGDGLRAYVEIADQGGTSEVGLIDAVPVAEITQLIGRIGGAIGCALEQAAPNKAKVELGLTFGLEAGQLAALIARGSGEANLKITLEWERG